MSEKTEAWCQVCGDYKTVFRFNGGTWHCNGGHHTVEVDGA